MNDRLVKFLMEYMDKLTASRVAHDLREAGWIAPTLDIKKIREFTSETIAPLIKDAYEGGELD